MKSKIYLCGICTIVICISLIVECFGQTIETSDQVKRVEFTVQSEPGIEIFVRQVTGFNNNVYDSTPILLIHGGGPGGLTSFDIGVEGYSLAEIFADASHRVYVMNIRGWEHSTKPAALNQPAEANPPVVTMDDAVTDIKAVVNEILEHEKQQKVALIGWATGGHWAGAFASNEPDKVSHLIMLNSLYGAEGYWELAEICSDGKGGRQGAYRLADADGLLARWNRSIPTKDKSEWRDPKVAKAYVDLTLKYDSTAYERQPPSVRIPLGYWPESCRMAQGEKLWNASTITVPVMAVRGERDFWSRPEDLAALKADLVNAPKVDTVTIADGTHYLFLDRPKRGRDKFVEMVFNFISNELN